MRRCFTDPHYWKNPALRRSREKHSDTPRCNIKLAINLNKSHELSPPLSHEISPFLLTILPGFIPPFDQPSFWGPGHPEGTWLLLRSRAQILGGDEWRPEAFGESHI